jgi:hypothetical protein
MMSAPRARLWRELRPFVGPALVVLAYAVLRLIHSAVAGDRGVLTPSGSVDQTLAALAFATFLLRLLALVVVPFVVVYRLVMRALHSDLDRG